MRCINKFLFLLSLHLLLLPPKTCADPWKRARNPRELQPFGQMRDEIYEKTSTFRLIRTQEERRPRDARALGPQDLGPPGIARPELAGSIRKNRKKTMGGGWFWLDELSQSGDEEGGWSPMLDEPLDPEIIHSKSEMTKTEWWEQKFRGQGQRGGWFRARFGSGSSSGGIRTSGGTATQSQQQPSSSTGSGGMGNSMMGGGGGMMGGSR
jgi:hypothetical protein